MTLVSGLWFPPEYWPIIIFVAIRWAESEQIGKDQEAGKLVSHKSILFFQLHSVLGILTGPMFARFLANAQ